MDLETFLTDSIFELRNSNAFFRFAIDKKDDLFLLYCTAIITIMPIYLLFTPPVVLY